MRICIAGLTEDALALGLVLRHYGLHSVVVWRTEHQPWLDQESYARHPGADLEILGLLGDWVPLPVTHDRIVAAREGHNLLVLTGDTQENTRALREYGHSWYGPVVTIAPRAGAPVSNWAQIGHTPFHYRSDPVNRLLTLDKIVVDTRSTTVLGAIVEAWTSVDNKIPIRPPWNLHDRRPLHA